ncbi:MAG: GntR family transcriptional regulator [Hyphomicrobiaceae bacterium]
MAPLVRRTLTEQTYAELRRRILGFEYPVGDRLDVETIARELEVSPSPVKDALRQLASEGLVEIQPRRGTSIRRFSRADVMEIFGVRGIIEPGAMAAAARGGGLTPAVMAALEDTFREIAAASEGHDFRDHAAALEADTQFHLLVVEATGNAELLALARTFLGKARMMRHFAQGLPRAQATIEEHRRIVDALKSGREAAIESAVRDHLRRARDGILALMDERGL